MARLGWFPRWAKVQLYGFWGRTGLACHWPWDVKSTIRKAVLPKHNTKLDCIRKTGGYLQLRSFTFLHCKIYIQRMAAGSSPKVVVLAQLLLLYRLKWPKKHKHGLEQQFWYLVFTTSTVAPLRVARLGWFPSQAKLQLYGFWRRTAQVCHGPWDVKSTIRKAVLPKHNTKLDCIRKTGGYLQLRSFTFLHCKIYIQRMAAGSSPKVVVLAQLLLL